MLNPHIRVYKGPLCTGVKRLLTGSAAWEESISLSWLQGKDGPYSGNSFPPKGLSDIHRIRWISAMPVFQSLLLVSGSLHLSEGTAQLGGAEGSVCACPLLTRRLVAEVKGDEEGSLIACVGETRETHFLSGA